MLRQERSRDVVNVLEPAVCMCARVDLCVYDLPDTPTRLSLSRARARARSLARSLSLQPTPIPLRVRQIVCARERMSGSEGGSARGAAGVSVTSG